MGFKVPGTFTGDQPNDRGVKAESFVNIKKLLREYGMTCSSCAYKGYVTREGVNCKRHGQSRKADGFCDEWKAV